MFVKVDDTYINTEHVVRMYIGEVAVDYIADGKDTELAIHFTDGVKRFYKGTKSEVETWIGQLTTTVKI